MSERMRHRRPTSRAAAPDTTSADTTPTDTATVDATSADVATAPAGAAATREPAPHEARVRAVRHRLATALLPPQPAGALGDVHLLPHQRQAVARLHRILDRHGGALLADAMGLGKTYSALAVAQRYDRVAVLTPAGLVAMWEAALLRTRQRQVTVHSLHLASCRPLEPLGDRSDGSDGDNRGAPRRGLVIIDEAHALRNPRTARYRHVANAVQGCDVLLLSATPLHNRPEELATLFALFRGTRPDALAHDTLDTLIVRRTQIVTMEHAAAGAGDTTPRLRTHRPLTVPQHAGTLERLLAIPAPLPARGGAMAGALIRLGLLRAWCSSDAALTQALTARLQRSAAMRAALDAGRHPTAQELRSWLVDERSGGDLQLGFTELLAADSVENEDQRRHLLDLLARHEDALRALRVHHVQHARADAARAAWLRAIRRRHPAVPVVAFSQHGRTIRALFRALSDIAGVGMLTSQEARIASGTVSRPELLGWFAPRAQGRPPPPPQLRLWLLLATDLLSEGVNLQDAGVVVHLDLPWTHALRTQRTGRVRRMGSPHTEVHEYRLQAMASARRVLRLEARVARKAALAARLVGATSVPEPRHAAEATTGHAAASAADLRTAWMDRLERWVREGASLPPCRVATLPSAAGLTGAIVLVHVRTSDGEDGRPRAEGGVQLLAVVRTRQQRWWVSTRAAALLAVSDGRWPPRCSVGRAEAAADAAAAASLRDADAAEAMLSHAVRRVVWCWWRRSQVRAAMGLATAGESGHGGIDRAPGGPLNVTQRQAMHWLLTTVAGWPVSRRAQHAAAVTAARARIDAARGAAGESALRHWMSRPHESPEALLAGWRAFPALGGGEGPLAPQIGGIRTPVADAGPHTAGAGAPRIVACLYVVPA